MITVFHSFFHVAKLYELCSLCQALWFGVVVFRLFALLGKFLGEALRVDVSQDVSHFFKVAICDHPIGLIKDEYIYHGQCAEQIGVILVVHQLPQTTRCRHDDCRFVAEKSLLLLNRHATDECSHFERLLVLDRNDSFDHVLDLDGQLSRWTQHKASHALEGIGALTLLALISSYLLDAKV